MSEVFNSSRDIKDISLKPNEKIRKKKLKQFTHAESATKSAQESFLQVMETPPQNKMNASRQSGMSVSSIKKMSVKNKYN